MTDKKKSLHDWGIIQKKNKTTGKLEWYARIVRVDGNGKARQFARKAESKTEARRFRDELSEKFEERGEVAIEGSKLLFRELASVYQEKRLHEAVYHGEGVNRRKVSGVRSLQSSTHYLDVLRSYFGAKLIRDISHMDIETFKRKRLQEPSIRGERSMADVNRSLELLRAMLRFAARHGWLKKSPFEMGDSLISKAAEVKRKRVLSFDEESRLLAASVKRRKQLRPLIIVAVDTAMRRGELFKLTWQSVDFFNKKITVLALNSKTAKEREVGMTERVKDELNCLWENSDKNLDGLVFGITTTVKTSFASACKEAGIFDFRFHDLRHTGLTRMIQSGVPPMELMAISGHQQMNTFARYINPDTGAVQKIASMLTRHNASQVSNMEVSELIN